MKLSVVIPVCNCAPYLRECLNSVALATERAEARGGQRTVEIVCVDDGSTDGSGKMLDEYLAETAKRDGGGEWNVIHQPNRGVSAARNAALEVATGDWVGFVDADDSVAPDWFAHLLALVRDDVDIVHADARFCIGEPLVSRTEGESWRVENPCRMFLRDGWSFLNLVRRETIGPVRFPEGMRFKEDVVFFARVAARARQVVAANLRGYSYRRHPGSAIAQSIRDEDCQRFVAEVSRLDLPRREIGRAVGFDLILWVKGRDWSAGYDGSRCPVLRCWRESVAAGTLKVSDVRGWWRPGLRHWLRTGDLRWLVRTRAARVWFEGFLRGLKW